MALIAISGRIGAGKDTLAAKIINGSNEPWRSVAFATVLKGICAVLTGELDQISRGAKAKYLPEWGKTVGELQQIIGTDVMRHHFDDDVWIKALLGRYKPLTDYWIVTDMRFPNELLAVRRLGGLTVRIDGSRTGPQGRDPYHISETSLDDWAVWGYRFENNGTMKDLENHAAAVINKELDQRGIL